MRTPYIEENNRNATPSPEVRKRDYLLPYYWEPGLFSGYGV